MIEIGSRIKNLRKQKSFTQEQLAKRLWVTKSIISAYENGTRFPSLENLVQIAYLFNVSTDYLLGVDKKQLVDVSGLSNDQIEIIRKIIDQFKI